MKKKSNTYKKSGVNIRLANTLVKYIAKKTSQTKKTGFDNIGAFGATFDISNQKIKDPLIVSCTDGVGTKIEIANDFKKFDSIGIDLVAMSVNDLIVQGAKPLFFLDYLAVGKLNLKKTKKIINGILAGCRLSGCKLIGGETAEMPGTYQKNKFDLAGFAVGIVSKKKILSKKKVKSGDIILAIPSSGIHSNGYSLVRSVIKNKKLSHKIQTQLLKPTKIYVNEILSLCKKNLIKSCAHITGGGLIENLDRSIPTNLSLNIDLSKIKIKKIFKWLKKHNISSSEMLNTFNCGIGFCIITKKKNIKHIKKIFTKEYEPYQIGFVSNESKRINLKGKIQW